MRFWAPLSVSLAVLRDDASKKRPRARSSNLERVLVAREIPRRVAAILIEPVVGSNGVIVYPDGYLPALRALTEKHGILLIADEVMTGFGRTGAAFACQRFGVVPDMMTFAKGVTSAYVPLGGVMIRESLAFDLRRPRPPERSHVLGPPDVRRDRPRDRPCVQGGEDLRARPPRSRPG